MVCLTTKCGISCTVIWVKCGMFFCNHCLNVAFLVLCSCGIIIVSVFAKGLRYIRGERVLT